MPHVVVMAQRTNSVPLQVSFAVIFRREKRLLISIDDWQLNSYIENHQKDFTSAVFCKATFLTFEK